MVGAWKAQVIGIQRYDAESITPVVLFSVLLLSYLLQRGLIPPIAHVCLNQWDWEFIRVLPVMSYSSSWQFIRKGHSGEEPLWAAAIGGAERPGKPERSSQQSPAGPENADGTGESFSGAILHRYSSFSTESFLNLNSGGNSIFLCFSELEHSGWAGVTEAAGCQAATAALDTAEDVRGQVRRAGGRATQQSVNQGFTRSHKERSAQSMRKSKKWMQMAGRIRMSSVPVWGCSWCFFLFQTGIVWGEKVVVQTSGEDEDGVGNHGDQIRGEEEEIGWTSTGGTTHSETKLLLLSLLSHE